MLSVLKILKESFVFAYQSLVHNKLRTILSLLGITIGIFCIISVFTVVDSLKSNIQTSIDKLGKDVVFIQKWPWSFGGDYPWWKYWQRPEASYRDYIFVKNNATKAAQVCIEYSMSTNAKYKDINLSDVSMIGVSSSYPKIQNVDIQEGRFFSQYEENSAAPVGIIGYDIAKKMFNSGRALQKEFRVNQHRITIIGVLKKQGSGIISSSKDDAVIMPESYIRRNFNVNSSSIGKVIMVSAKKDVSVESLKSQLRLDMRAIRQLKPKSDDNFALNETSLLSQGFEQLFSVINIAGLIIGLFSIVVGGFSIANIMFVSVKERTRQIGIKKSLGAKSYFILLEFLFESVALCIIGGLVGLLFIFACVLLMDNLTPMSLSLSFNNILWGIFISVLIGIISGILPAFSASRMNPVDAIRG